MQVQGYKTSDPDLIQPDPGRDISVFLILQKQLSASPHYPVWAPEKKQKNPDMPLLHFLPRIPLLYHQAEIGSLPVPAGNLKLSYKQTLHTFQPAHCSFVLFRKIQMPVH